MRIILVGGGKTLYFLARQFIEKGHQLTIINRDAVEAKSLSRQLKATIILGEGSDPEILEEAGARRANALLSLTPHDPDNLVACQIARQMFGVPRTVALVNDPENEDIFRQLGVTVAFSATKIITTLIEQQADFDDITNLIPVAEGRVNVTEVTLDQKASAADKRLSELNLPSNSLIAGIIREGKVLVPGGASQLRVADRLILITLPENQAEVLHTLIGETDI
ncbi:MAG: TrkA family potassium uptake protein [Anaerolineae bacterium]|nr:TrkA family potassium uptake protein [Anaerolineae bacterium]